MSKLAPINGQKRLILQAVDVALAAYLSDVVAPEMGFDSSLSQIRLFSRGNSSGFVAKDAKNNRVWVGFAGTQDIKDWKDDAAYSHVQFNGCTRGSVHCGYSRHYERIRELFIANFNALEGVDDAEIVFVGHSLGGALAQIAAVKTSDAGYSTRAIVFGCPRVFDPKASYYATHVSRTIITRIESLTDWVCDLPTRAGRYPYSHAGRGLFIDWRGKVTTEDRPSLFKFIQWLRRVLRWRWAWDVHSMAEYKRRVAKWLEQ